MVHNEYLNKSLFMSKASPPCRSDCNDRSSKYSCGKLFIRTMQILFFLSCFRTGDESGYDNKNENLSKEDIKFNEVEIDVSQDLYKDRSIVERYALICLKYAFWDFKSKDTQIENNEEEDNNLFDQMEKCIQSVLHFHDTCKNTFKAEKINTKEFQLKFIRKLNSLFDFKIQLYEHKLEIKSKTDNVIKEFPEFKFYIEFFNDSLDDFFKDIEMYNTNSNYAQVQGLSSEETSAYDNEIIKNHKFNPIEQNYDNGESSNKFIKSSNISEENCYTVKRQKIDVESMSNKDEINSLVTEIEALTIDCDTIVEDDSIKEPVYETLKIVCEKIYDTSSQVSQINDDKNPRKAISMAFDNMIDDTMSILKQILIINFEEYLESKLIGSYFAFLKIFCDIPCELHDDDIIDNYITKNEHYKNLEIDQRIKMFHIFIYAHDVYNTKTRISKTLGLEQQVNLMHHYIEYLLNVALFTLQIANICKYITKLPEADITKITSHFKQSKEKIPKSFISNLENKKFDFIEKFKTGISKYKDVRKEVLLRKYIILENMYFRDFKNADVLYEVDKVSFNNYEDNFENYESYSNEGIQIHNSKVFRKDANDKYENLVKNYISICRNTTNYGYIKRSSEIVIELFNPAFKYTIFHHYTIVDCLFKDIYGNSIDKLYEIIQKSVNKEKEWMDSFFEIYKSINDSNNINDSKISYLHKFYRIFRKYYDDERKEIKRSADHLFNSGYIGFVKKNYHLFGKLHEICDAISQTLRKIHLESILNILFYCVEDNLFLYSTF